MSVLLRSLVLPPGSNLFSRSCPFGAVALRIYLLFRRISILNWSLSAVSILFPQKAAIFTAERRWLNLTCSAIIIIIIIIIRVFCRWLLLQWKHRNLRGSSAKGRSSTANSGTKAVVLRGMNRCISFPLLSDPRGTNVEWREINSRDYKGRKGNKCHPFNSRRGRLKEQKIYTVYNMGSKLDILRKRCILFCFVHVVLLMSLEIMRKNLHQ